MIRRVEEQASAEKASVSVVDMKELRRSYPNGHQAGVGRRNSAKDHQRDIGDLLFARPRTGLVVEHRRVYVTQRNAGMTDIRNEFAVAVKKAGRTTRSCQRTKRTCLDRSLPHS